MYAVASNVFVSTVLCSPQATCVNTCARKHINVNHKIMQVYMEVQPLIVQQRMDEMNKKAEESMEALNKKEAESLKASESSIESQPSTEIGSSPVN